jgi:hypothetical protein
MKEVSDQLQGQKCRNQEKNAVAVDLGYRDDNGMLPTYLSYFNH